MQNSLWVKLQKNQQQTSGLVTQKGAARRQRRRVLMCGWGVRREMDGGWKKQEEKGKAKTKTERVRVTGGRCDGSKLTIHKLYLPG